MMKSKTTKEKFPNSGLHGESEPLEKVATRDTPKFGHLDDLQLSRLSHRAKLLLEMLVETCGLDPFSKSNSWVQLSENFQSLLNEGDEAYSRLYKMAQEAGDIPENERPLEDKDVVDLVETK